MRRRSIGVIVVCLVDAGSEQCVRTFFQADVNDVSVRSRIVL